MTKIHLQDQHTRGGCYLTPKDDAIEKTKIKCDLSPCCREIQKDGWTDEDVNRIIENEDDKYDAIEAIKGQYEREALLQKDTTNPKDLIGCKKDNIHLVPPEAIRQISKAMKNGADKYGAYNWRKKKVQMVIYIDALLRHTLALADGEEIDPDSGLPHLSHIGANAAILIDATKQGNLIDNRYKVKK